MGAGKLDAGAVSGVDGVEFDASEFIESSPSNIPWYHTAPFYADLLACSACPCRAEASRVVPGVGTANAEIVFLGRNPGRDEDSRGLPFVGRGGFELDKMMSALGLDRSKVGIVNLVKCYTKDDRAPKPIEVLTCMELWLEKELAFFHKAKLIFPLGKEAVQAVLGPTALSPGRREGYLKLVRLKDRAFMVIPLNHPGYILRARGQQLEMYNATLPRVKAFMEKELAGVYARARQ